MKRCPKCGVRVLLLKTVEGQHSVWVHSEPGDPPYLYCRYSKAAPPTTVGEWAMRLLDPFTTLTK